MHRRIILRMALTTTVTIIVPWRALSLSIHLSKHRNCWLRNSMTTTHLSSRFERVCRFQDTTCRSSSTTNLITESIKIKSPVARVDQQQARRRWLVVGDGDLSYSASIAAELAIQNIHLTATVLEDEQRHLQVYERSEENAVTIVNASVDPQDISSQSQEPHSVLFGVDATQLSDTFPSTVFHRIIFNFPHWRGKTNAKRNRQLVDDFLHSASHVLVASCDDSDYTNGEISISLCDGQGGFPSATLADWRQSWLVPAYAAEHGLLLQKLEAYQPLYTRSSHRGVDRPWKKSGNNQVYTFGFPNGKAVDPNLQLSIRHELRVMLHPEKLEQSSSVVSRSDIIDGDAVLQLVQPLVPDGIEVEVAARDLLTPEEWNGDHVPLAIFLMNYSGVSMPLTRQRADEIRAQLEAAVQEQWHLDVAKGGRLVSRPYPRHLLPTLIKEYSH